MAARRTYSTELRSAQTVMAKRLIVEVAGQLFADKGYGRTTLADVAAAAGVSVQTVYNVVGGKAVLLKAAYDVMLAGDDEPVAIADRPEFQAMMAAPDGRACLAHYAELSRMLGERVLPLVTALHAQAAAGDPALQTFIDTIEGERAIGSRNTAGLVAERFGLRPGMTVSDAADVLWVLNAPDLADRLVNRRGWGWDKTQRWIGTAMGDALLGPER